MKLEKTSYTIRFTRGELVEIIHLIHCASEALEDRNNKWTKVCSTSSANSIKEELLSLIGDYEE